MASCGETLRENTTYFVNPHYPNQYDSTGSCQITILKANPNVCQIRLDLEHFALVGPEPLNHVCNTDQLIVSGGSPVPIICGVAHGEHSKNALIHIFNELNLRRFSFQTKQYSLCRRWCWS